MKKWILAAGMVAFATVAQAQYGGGYGTGSNSSSHSTSGYMRSNGTYVQPYTATNPNSTTRDNYGTQGNYNPNNGHIGTRSLGRGW
jgi:hypothetical protein